MPFKINIGAKDSKTFKLESNTENLVGKKIGESISGSEIDAKLAGYELEITGSSDKAGFPGLKEVEGVSLKKVILTHGTGMRKFRPKGFRIKKTVRGNTLSRDTIQINLKVTKTGEKKLEELFPEQVKAKEGEKVEVKEKKEEAKPESVKEEQKESKEEKVEEKKEEKENKEEKKEGK